MRILRSVHPDWETEPSVSTPFQRPWTGIHVIDQVAYITGKGVDGKRYCRVVEVSSRTEEKANRRLGYVLNAVTRGGPSLCTTIEDGGALPRESEQPPIE